MTLTTKSSLELTSAGKSGSPSQSSENKSGESPRTNPVCLDVPVTVRSLPAENSELSGPSESIREEGKTVIVFDNGAVLRLSNTVPSGQKVILSNAQGNEVVCRVVQGRNLPTVKGYIEIEFIEPCNDFWNIHQSAEPVHVPPPPNPVHASQLPLPVAHPSAAPVTPPLAPLPGTPENETVSPSGSAPTFKDIAGLVRMSQPAAGRIKTNEPAAQVGALKNKKEAAPGKPEPAKSHSTINTPKPILDATSAKRSIPAVEGTSSLPGQRRPASHDFLARGMLASGQMASASPTGQPRRRIPLVMGGLVLVLAGFGGGYFYMHQESALVPAPSAAVAVQSSSSLPARQRSEAQPVQASQPTVDQTPDPTEAVSEISAPAPEAEVSTSPGIQSRPRAGNPMGANPPEKVSKKRPTIPSLKLRSPSAPKGDLAKLSVGSAPNMTNVPSAVAVTEAPVTAMLSPVVRSENQPTPPPSLGSPAPSSKIVREPKLILSTRPSYPSVAKELNTQGIVVVSAEVDVKGNVTNLKAISGPISLRQAAMEAVKQWKYSPALIDGKPSTAQVTVNVEFRLN